MALSKSKRMWGSYIGSFMCFAITIYAINKGMETTANIALAGGIAILMEYLGLESMKPSKH